MKVVITGACGFVGRNLIKELESHGFELILIDRQKPGEATVFVPGSGERVFQPLKAEWPFHLGDIMDVNAMRAAIKGADAIVHLAASPTGEPEKGVQTFSFNALGTFNLLDLSRQFDVSRFLVASSINAFGTFYWRINPTPVHYSELPLTEQFPAVPQDPYSLSKLVNEETCAAFHRAYGIRTAALRFGAVMQKEWFEQSMANGLPATEAWSDDLYTWVHIQDIVTAIRQALEALQLPGYGAYTLNAADTRCPEPTLELINKFKPEYRANLTIPIDGRGALISTEKARLAFGYSPKYRLDK